MNTLAVMCMAFTRHSPSRTPLLATEAATCGVMFRKSIRAGMLKVKYSVSDFISRDAPNQSTLPGLAHPGLYQMLAVQTSNTSRFEGAKRIGRTLFVCLLVAASLGTFPA